MKKQCVPFSSDLDLPWACVCVCVLCRPRPVVAPIAVKPHAVAGNSFTLDVLRVLSKILCKILCKIPKVQAWRIQCKEHAAAQSYAAPGPGGGVRVGGRAGDGCDCGSGGGSVGSREDARLKREKGQVRHGVRHGCDGTPAENWVCARMGAGAPVLFPLALGFLAGVQSSSAGEPQP